MATENIGGAGVSGNPNAASSSRSNSTADSYIGSLISLTSKSEIRYEGVLYNINTEESSIGLRNVRSFGTEGRKKDGPQIPASDKVYEYILFRGSDIKDLQVKSSPPVQPTPPIHNDPAIIQSHYPRPVPSSTSVPSAAAGAGSLSDIGSLNAPMGLTGSNFQGGLPLYQPGGNLATWGASPPPPTANGSGLAMPMYWQGYYGPPNALPQHLHQQSLLRPPPGLSMPASLQQPLQYPNFNTPLPSGNSTLPNANLSASNLPVSTLPGSNLPVATSSASSLPVSGLPASTLPEIPNPLLPVGTNAHTLTSTPSVPSTLSSALPLLPSSTLASETLPSWLSNKPPSAALPAANLTTSLPSLSPLTTTSPEINTMVPPMSNKPATLSTPSIPYQNSMQSVSSGAVASNSLRVETPTPPLVTPGQLLQSGPAPSQTVQEAHKDVEVVQVSSSSPPEASVPIAAESKPPILPLPAPSRATYRPNGAHFQNRQGYHGRGRGSGSSRPVTKFTEDFDFMAMNEKFNKDEVWGHLGKNKSKDKDDGNFGDEDDSEDEQDDELAKIDAKPVYNKDDFFDTLSCNSLNHDPQNGRPKFSEQMKIDTETFGDFSRYRGGRGGRGPPRGGRSRGSYYGRDYGRGYNYGYGHVGRGRGRGMPSRAT